MKKQTYVYDTQISTGTLEDDVNLKQFFVNKGEAWKEQAIKR